MPGQGHEVERVPTVNNLVADRFAQKDRCRPPVGRNFEASRTSMEVREGTMHAMRDYALWLSGLSLAGLSRPLARNHAAEERATAAARSWLVVLDAGRSSWSFDAAAPVVRKALTREQWERAVQAVRAPLGRCLWRTLRSRQLVDSLAQGPKGPFAVIRFETHFERKPDAVETIIPALGGDGRWRVAGYFIA